MNPEQCPEGPFAAFRPRLIPVSAVRVECSDEKVNVHQATANTLALLVPMVFRKEKVKRISPQCGGSR